MDRPFGDGVAVFKVGGRMFALVVLDGEPGFVTLKCDPQLAIALRAQYEAVRPGDHTNERLWNSVDLDGSVPDMDHEVLSARMLRTSAGVFGFSLSAEEVAQIDALSGR